MPAGARIHPWEDGHNLKGPREDFCLEPTVPLCVQTPHSVTEGGLAKQKPGRGLGVSGRALSPASAAGKQAARGLLTAALGLNFLLCRMKGLN